MGRRIASAIEPTLVVVGFVGAWELLTRSGVLPRDSFPPATRIAEAFAEDVAHSSIWNGVTQSMQEWAIGMGIVIVAAVLIGSLLGLSRLAYRATMPTLEFLRTVPSVAALPILLFVYGTGAKLNILLVVITALWPLLLQTMYGVHDVDPVARDTARVYGIGRIGSFFRVVLPSALPYIVTGLRVSAVLGLLVAVAASLIVGGEGLGERIDAAQRNDQTELVYARIFLTSLLGLLVTFALVALERRVLRWHPSQRMAA